MKELQIKLPKELVQEINACTSQQFTLRDRLYKYGDTYMLRLDWKGKVSGVQHTTQFNITRESVSGTEYWHLTANDFVITKKGRLIRGDELCISDYFVQAFDDLFDFIEELEKK